MFSASPHQLLLHLPFCHFFFLYFNFFCTHGTWWDVWGEPTAIAKNSTVFGSRIERRAQVSQHVYSCSVAPAGDCNSDCVSRWRDAESPISLTAPSHTRCHTPSQWPPCFTMSYANWPFFLKKRNFACVAVREQSYLKRRDYSHFNHTSTINLLLDNVRLLLSMIAVALLHLKATHLKRKKSAFFFFISRCIQCLLPGNHNTAS